MELDFVDSLEVELSVIVRAILQRNGGKLSVSAEEMPRGQYTIDIDHMDDGSITVHLHEHGVIIQ